MGCLERNAALAETGVLSFFMSAPGSLGWQNERPCSEGSGGRLLALGYLISE